MIKKSEFLIIGSGVAGMSYALKVANAGKGKVTLICKTTLEEANTARLRAELLPSQTCWLITSRSTSKIR